MYPIYNSIRSGTVGILDDFGKIGTGKLSERYKKLSYSQQFFGHHPKQAMNWRYLEGVWYQYHYLTMRN